MQCQILLVLLLLIQLYRPEEEVDFNAKFKKSIHFKCTVLEQCRICHKTELYNDLVLATFLFHNINFKIRSLTIKICSNYPIKALSGQEFFLFFFACFETDWKK